MVEGVGQVTVAEGRSVTYSKKKEISDVSDGEWQVF